MAPEWNSDTLGQAMHEPENSSKSFSKFFHPTKRVFSLWIRKNLIQFRFFGILRIPESIPALWEQVPPSPGNLIGC